MLYEEIENLSSRGRGLAGEMRQKPTVEAGLVAKETAMGRTYVDYQPGNGTRYSFLFVEIVGMPEMKHRAGGHDHAWLITNLIRGTSMLVGHDGFVAPRYVAEKLGQSEPDSVVIGELIGHILGQGSVSCEEYLRSVYTEETA